jgi:hypothetical protein
MRCSRPATRSAWHNAKRFAARGIEFAYPTQTTYTAAPDGTLVMPYAEPKSATSAPRKKG